MPVSGTISPSTGSIAASTGSQGYICTPSYSRSDDGSKKIVHNKNKVQTNSEIKLKQKLTQTFRLIIKVEAAIEPVAQVTDVRPRKLTRGLQRCHITVGEEIL